MKALPGLPQAAADCMHQICEMDEGLSLICPIAICHRVPHNWGRVPDIICKFGLHDSRLSSRALIDWISEPLGSIVCPGCVANPHQACHRPLGWAGSTLHTSNETPFYRIAFSLVKLSNLLGRSRPNHTKWFLNADDRIESLSILGWVHDPNYIPYVSSTHGTTLSCPVAKAIRLNPHQRCRAPTCSVQFRTKEHCTNARWYSKRGMPQIRRVTFLLHPSLVQVMLTVRPRCHARTWKHSPQGCSNVSFHLALASVAPAIQQTSSTLRES